MRFRHLGALTVALGAVAIAACTASTTEGVIPPVTALRVDTLDLFGVDSCGPGEAQIAKVVVTRSLLRAVVGDASVDATAASDAAAEDAGAVDVDAGSPEDDKRATFVNDSSTFDCFADPAFPDIVPQPGSYDLMVYGFSAPQYAAHTPAIAAAVARRGSGTAEDVRIEAARTLRALATVVAQCTGEVFSNVNNTAACTIIIDRRPQRSAADASSELDASADASDATDASDAADPTDASDASDASDAATDGDAATQGDD